MDINWHQIFAGGCFPSIKLFWPKAPFLNMFGEVYMNNTVLEWKFLMNWIDSVRRFMANWKYQKAKVRNKYSYKSGAIFHGSFIGLRWRLIEAYSLTSSTLHTLSHKKICSRNWQFWDLRILGKVSKSLTNNFEYVGVCQKFNFKLFLFFTTLFTFWVMGSNFFLHGGWELINGQSIGCLQALDMLLFE